MRNLKTLLLACSLVVAVVTAGCSEDPVAPVAPVDNLSVSALSDNSMQITWTYAGTADNFKIMRNDVLVGTAAGSARSHTDTGLTVGAVYTYKVVAVSGGNSSGAASIVVTAGMKRAILAGGTGTNAVVTLSKDTTYVVQGFYFIQPGTKLVIPAGTRIEGDFATKGAIITVRGTSTRASGQIEARGTAAEPIVFTSSRPEGQRQRGDWGGIVLSGLADLNVPGKVGAGEGGTGSYGYGNVVASAKNDDNSGILQYVRIEFGGTKVTTDNEINGLTMNAVGTGTVIENVQSHMIADDGFEWFGGTVNCKYLVSSGNDDDAFDMDFGYSGKCQFLFAIQDPDKANRGFEVDNDASGSSNEPFTSATIANVTLIGTGRDKGANDDNNDGFYLRRNNKLKIYNALVTNFRYGLVVDGSGTGANATAGDLFVKNSILNGSAGGFSSANAGDLTAVYAGWNNRTDAAVTLPSISFTSPNPVPGVAVLTGAMNPSTIDAWFASANYIGAFDPAGASWINGWTTFKKS